MILILSCPDSKIYFYLSKEFWYSWPGLRWSQSLLFSKTTIGFTTGSDKAFMKQKIRVFLRHLLFFCRRLSYFRNKAFCRDLWHCLFLTVMHYVNDHMVDWRCMQLCIIVELIFFSINIITNLNPNFRQRIEVVF